MYPLSERELRQGANADAPPFLHRIFSNGIDDILLPPDVPDINGYVDRALRSGFPNSPTGSARPNSKRYGSRAISTTSSPAMREPSTSTKTPRRCAATCTRWR